MQNEHKEAANELAALEKKVDALLDIVLDLHRFTTRGGNVDMFKYHDTFKEQILQQLN